MTLGQLAAGDSPSWKKIIASFVNVANSIYSGKIVESIDGAIETLLESVVFTTELFIKIFANDDTKLIEIKLWAGEFHLVSN